MLQEPHKELSTGHGGGHPLSSELGPNHVRMVINALAHNLRMSMWRVTHDGEHKPRLKLFDLLVNQIPYRLINGCVQYLLRFYNGGYDDLMRWDKKFRTVLKH